MSTFLSVRRVGISTVLLLGGDRASNTLAGSFLVPEWT